MKYVMQNGDKWDVTKGDWVCSQQFERRSRRKKKFYSLWISAIAIVAASIIIISMTV